MNLTLGQKLICGISLIAAMLLAASVRISCTDDRVGSIHVGAKKLRGNEPAKAPARTIKPQNRGVDGPSRNRRS